MELWRNLTFLWQTFYNILHYFNQILITIILKKLVSVLVSQTFREFFFIYINIKFVAPYTLMGYGINELLFLTSFASTFLRIFMFCQVVATSWPLQIPSPFKKLLAFLPLNGVFVWISMKLLHTIQLASISISLENFSDIFYATLCKLEHALHPWMFRLKFYRQMADKKCSEKLTWTKN